MVSCAPGGGCNGGWTDAALDYTSGPAGQTTERRYPYSEVTGRCDSGVVGANAAGNSVRLAGPTRYVVTRSEAALRAAVDESPVAFYFAVASAFSRYGGGVFDPAPGDCASAVNHAMVIVGYGGDGDGGYWIVKNSWGTGWGEGGYARVAMTGDGDGPCGMYTYLMQAHPGFDSQPLLA
eukprot:365055-Chlamydomonas_euryale.AAC.2